MAWIDELSVSVEEKEVFKKRMSALLSAHKQEELTAQQITLFFNEWKEIAVRLKNGSALLDKTDASQENAKSHLHNLQTLYIFLLRLLGVYDHFFKTKFKQNADRYNRAQLTILAELK